MNKFAWCAAALVVFGAGAAGLGGTGCTVTSTSGDDGGITSGYDAGTQDVATGQDTGTQEDTGTTGQDSGGGDSGMVCNIAPSTPMGATCDSCVQSRCDTEWCACAGDTTTDDAGIPQCINDIGCISDCLAGNPDAGVAPGTPQDCEMACGSAYSSTENQNAAALLNCLANNCASQCQ